MSTVAHNVAAADYEQSSPGPRSDRDRDTDQLQSLIGLLQEKLASLRAKLGEPNLTKESMLMLTTDLQPVYKKLLLTDLDRGVQKQLENFLWNDCFKRPLSALSKVDQGLFHMMIESGIGFYLGMIQEIGDYFPVQLGGQNETQTLYCTTPKSKPPSKQDPSKDVVYYIIQNSLIHVGDLLRYRSSFEDAQRMYEKATKINPNSGHPWNQMGLVQLLISGSIESILLGVYCYARALSVSSPFIPAQQNLDGLLHKAQELQSESTTDELILSFLRQVLSITSGSPSPTRFTLQPAQVQAEAHVNTQAPMEKLTRDHLVLMIVISLWVWKVESDKMYLGAKNANAIKALELVAAVINGMLAAKAIGSKEDEKFEIVAYLNIMLQWIHLHPEVLRESFKAELNTGAVCQVANQITALPGSYLATDEELGNMILPEERRLTGFLPVAHAYENLKVILDGSNPRCNAIRATRFLRLMHGFASPEYALIMLVGNEFRQIKFKVPPTILHPAPRQNVALQSLLKQMQKPTSSSSQSQTSQPQATPTRKTKSPTVTAAAAEGTNWNQGQQSPLNVDTQPRGLETTLPRYTQRPGQRGWEAELKLSSPVSLSASMVGPPPPGFQQRPHSGLSTHTPHHGHGHQAHARGTGGTGVGGFSADTSPVPSSTPTQLDGNFSLLFNSIWTPMGNETRASTKDHGGGGGGANPW